MGPNFAEGLERQMFQKRTFGQYWTEAFGDVPELGERDDSAIRKPQGAIPNWLSASRILTSLPSVSRGSVESASMVNDDGHIQACGFWEDCVDCQEFPKPSHTR